MITKPYLYISLCAAITVSTAFSSCSKDDDITVDDNPKTEIVVISPADSIITAPFVTITNKYDLSSVKKNGNEIYEGDIAEGDMGVFEVEWYDSVARFMFTPNTDMKWHPPFVCDQVKEMEVIGNIHENPELLGDEQ